MKKNEEKKFNERFGESSFFSLKSTNNIDFHTMSIVLKYVGTYFRLSTIQDIGQGKNLICIFDNSTDKSCFKFVFEDKIYIVKKKSIELISDCRKIWDKNLALTHVHSNYVNK